MGRADEFYTASLSYHFTPGGRSGGSRQPHKLEARESSGKQAGFIHWDAREDGQPGMVSNVVTHSQVRRRGVASSLWAQAHQQAASSGVNPPKHSDFRTPDGEAWVRGLANRKHSGVTKPRAGRRPGDGQESMF